MPGVGRQKLRESSKFRPPRGPPCNLYPPPPPLPVSELRSHIKQPGRDGAAGEVRDNPPRARARVISVHGHHPPSDIISSAENSIRVEPVTPNRSSSSPAAVEGKNARDGRTSPSNFRHGVAEFREKRYSETRKEVGEKLAREHAHVLTLSFLSFDFSASR